MVFWVMMPSSEDGGSMVLQNVGILPHQYEASWPKTPWPKSCIYKIFIWTSCQVWVNFTSTNQNI